MIEDLSRPEILVWLMPAIITIGAVLLGLAALVGLCLLIAPSMYFRVAEIANSWHPSEETMEKLDRQFAWSKFFYRHHVLFGLALILGSGYALLTWALNYDRDAFLRFANPYIVSSGLEWMVVAGEFIFVSLNLAALVFSIVVLFRPSLLKNFEGWSDQWVSPDTLASTLDREITLPDTVLRRRPRVIGAVILLACGYIIAVLLSPLAVLYQWIIG